MKIYAPLLLTLISTTAFAGSPAVFKAVLDVPEVAAFSTIEKLEVTETYKCPSCYDIQVTGLSTNGSNSTRNSVTIHTQGDFYTTTVKAEVKSQDN